MGHPVDKLFNHTSTFSSVYLQPPLLKGKNRHRALVQTFCMLTLLLFYLLGGFKWLRSQKLGGLCYNYRNKFLWVLSGIVHLIWKYISMTFFKSTLGNKPTPSSSYKLSTTHYFTLNAIFSRKVTLGFALFVCII